MEKLTDEQKQFVSLVASEYVAAKHEPKHPSYLAFCRETVAQFRGLLNSGWKFTRASDEPYFTSEEMFRDMERKRLAVFTGGSLAADNRLLWAVSEHSGNPEPHTVNPWLINEMFCAVHDVLGHGTGKHPFETFDGEVAAYREHKNWYSPEALPALYSETVGQLCYFYQTGKFVELQENKILKVRL